MEKPFKNLGPRWRKFVEHTRYRLDNFFMSGSFAQFTLLSVLTGCAIAFGMLVYFFNPFSDANNMAFNLNMKPNMGGGLFDSFWWSAMHILDYAHIAGDYGATWPIVVISAMETVMGMVLLAALIGLISTKFGEKIASLSSGTQHVREVNHILILGWNDKIYSIFDLFEDYSKKVTIVVLSNLTVAEMSDNMRTERAHISRIKPILRTGSPNNLSELERMAFRDAYSIIVLADESNANEDEEPDIRTIKTLMLLAGNLPPKPPRPKMVAEILRTEHMAVARIAARKMVSLVCSSDVLSRMIVQSSRQPGLSRVYSELFGFKGCEIYVQPHPKTANRPFGDVVFEFPNAIPLGTSGMEVRDGKPYFAQHMNPGKDYIIKETEWLILLSSEDHITHVPNPEHARETRFVSREARKFTKEKILILGWNDHLFTILTEYDTFLDPGSEITIVALHSEETANEILAEKIPGKLENATFKYISADYAMRDKLEAIIAEPHDICILLTDDSSEESDPDARTIVTQLLLQDFEERNPDKKFTQIISEIISDSNSELLHKSCKTDIIVSPKLISMLLAQVSQQLMLERVYADLMNAHSNEIYLKPVVQYTSHPENCVFLDLLRGSLVRGEIAIGVKIAADALDPDKKFGIHVNPPHEGPLNLTKDDEVIVISHGGHAGRAGNDR